MTPPPSHNVMKKPLQVMLIVALLLAVLVSCTSKKYVEVKEVDERLVIVNQRAQSCLDPVSLGVPKMLPVQLETAQLGGHTVVTLSQESVVNLKHNLKIIGDEAEKRSIYIDYLLVCLKSIANTSVAPDS